MLSWLALLLTWQIVDSLRRPFLIRVRSRVQVHSVELHIKIGSAPDTLGQPARKLVGIPPNAVPIPDDSTKKATDSEESVAFSFLMLFD